MIDFGAFNAYTVGPTLCAERMDYLETIVGAELPRTYRELLLKFGGSAVVFEKEVYYRPIVPSLKDLPDGTGLFVDMFYGLTHCHYGIFKANSTYGTRIPSGFYQSPEIHLEISFVSRLTVAMTTGCFSGTTTTNSSTNRTKWMDVTICF